MDGGAALATQPAIPVPWWAWAVLIAGLAVALAFDLLVVHRRAHVPTFQRALSESLVWIGLGVVVGAVMWATLGRRAGGEYYAGYLIEKSLSIDNVFVWALIMRYFSVPRDAQHRVLFWGIFVALVLRAIFIFGGVAIIDRFEFVLIGFGVFLLYTAIKLLVSDEDEMDPGSSRILGWARRVIPSTDQLAGQHLFVRVDGRRLATPLFFVLLVVEVSDVLFAVDSVPAVLAVSRDQFIVFASNAMAILGLRALFFLLADLHDRFRFLQHGLAVILAFVGIKMLLAEGVPDGWRGDWTPSWLRGVEIPIGWSLAAIAVVLVTSVVASLVIDLSDTEGST